MGNTKLEKTDMSFATSPETKTLDDSSARSLPLAKADFYKEMRLCGLNYSGDFRCVEKFHYEGINSRTQHRY